MFRSLYLFILFSLLDFSSENIKTKCYLYAHGIKRHLMIQKYNDDELKINTIAYVFMIHGEEDDSKALIYEQMIDEYEEERHGFSFLLFDWTKVEGDDLFTFDKCKTLIERIRKAGTDLQALIRKHAIPPNRVHLVGYSAGAHVAAAAAKQFPLWFEDKPYKITALDPARKCFEKLTEMNKDVRLDKNDAEMVNVLHTDAGGYGLDEKHLGKLNFYANGGRHQPGCKGDHVCSHRRALLYFKESIRFDHFAGMECESYKKNCKPDTYVTFSPATNLAHVVGNYFFNTSSSPPYGKMVSMYK